MSTLTKFDLQRLATDEHSRRKRVEHDTSLIFEDQFVAMARLISLSLRLLPCYDQHK